MSQISINEIQRKLDVIEKEYLFNISSLGNHDYFNQRKIKDNRTKHYKSTGFPVLSSNSENSFIVKEEMFLEGCTRVFLINPIFKMLMDIHGIENDWQFGHTFANYFISNREYELGSFIEFIAVFDGEKVGVRYTKTSYSSEERFAMTRDFGYTYGNEKIPGFDKLESIEKIYVLDWSGISEKELQEIHARTPEIENHTENMSVERFFKTYFSVNEYTIVIETAKRAIQRGKEIIALSAVPQLLPNNILNFKQAILCGFDEYRMNSINYEFEDMGCFDGLSSNDIKVINDNFFTNGYRESIIGDKDFARSFITSEYLYKTVKAGLSIDYTAVVVGYLKAVEQILYLLYISAFEGKSGMKYWDTCNRKQNFDESKANYRVNPYDVPEKEKMQEEYYHKKKMPDFAPEIGELTRFLRYYDKMWSVSEEGKEYIFRCLEDFRKSCRNSHFHKDNIDAEQYSKVERIRNNTYVCLYYLLGGFELLDVSQEKNKQLGIVDYSFEYLYQEIWQNRRRFFYAKFSDGLEDVICYLNDYPDAKYNSSGELMNVELHFVKTGLTKETACIVDLNQFIGDESCIKENMVCITRGNMPLKIEAFSPKKKTK